MGGQAGGWTDGVWVDSYMRVERGVGETQPRSACPAGCLRRLLPGAVSPRGGGAGLAPSRGPRPSSRDPSDRAQGLGWPSPSIPLRAPAGTRPLADLSPEAAYAGVSLSSEQPPAPSARAEGGVPPSTGTPGSGVSLSSPASFPGLRLVPSLPCPRPWPLPPAVRGASPLPARGARAAT